MKIDLNEVANNPKEYTWNIDFQGESYVLRLLEETDVEILVHFVDNLSSETRRFYSYSQSSEKHAQEMIEAIGVYDKLRFVLEVESSLVGLFEFSFDIPENDLLRYKDNGIILDEKVSCRFGLVLLDKLQSQGLGSLVLSKIVDIARMFDQQVIVLWGGVHPGNSRAIRFL